MSRIKEKLSLLINSQLPEFIRSDYDTFVAFIEAYYEYLEQDQGAQELLQNAISYSDIDRTTDDFVEYFIQQYCNNIPRNAFADKKVLVKYIKDLYSFKGSEKSFRLLFRLLYNEDVQFYYPKDDILIPSSGQWVQDAVIHLETINGDPYDAVGKKGVILNDLTANQIILRTITPVAVIEDPATGEAVVSDTIYEFLIDNTTNVPVQIGDLVEIGGYRGRVLPLPVGVKVISPGKNFKIGQTFDLKSGVTGIGATIKLTNVVKITNVDDRGAIINAELLKFGTGYSIDFYSTISSQKQIYVPGFSFNTTTGLAQVSEAYLGIQDNGVISKPTYADSTYFESDYGNEVLAYFNYVGVGQGGGSSENEAVLLITIGAKGKFPGYYRSNKGFLSDDVIKMQDADYYQPYSYVLQSKNRLEDYRKAVLDILHPAGLNLIGELLIANEFNVKPTLQTTFDFLRVIFLDTFTTSDLAAKTTIRPINTESGIDSANTIPIDSEPIKNLVLPKSNTWSSASEWSEDTLRRFITRPINNPNIPGYPGANDVTDTPILDGDSKTFNLTFNYTRPNTQESNITSYAANTIFSHSLIKTDIEEVLDDVAKSLSLPYASNVSQTLDTQTSNIQPAYISITDFDSNISNVEIARVLVDTTYWIDNVVIEYELPLFRQNAISYINLPDCLEIGHYTGGLYTEDTEFYFAQIYVGGNVISYCDPLTNKYTEHFLEDTLSSAISTPSTSQSPGPQDQVWIDNSGRAWLTNYSNLPAEYFLEDYVSEEYRDVYTPQTFSINISEDQLVKDTGYIVDANQQNYTEGYYDAIILDWTGYFQQPSSNIDQNYVGLTKIFTETITY